MTAAGDPSGVIILGNACACMGLENFPAILLLDRDAAIFSVPAHNRFISRNPMFIQRFRGVSKAYKYMYGKYIFMYVCTKYVLHFRRKSYSSKNIAM